jgi:hypothetical protein
MFNEPRTDMESANSQNLLSTKFLKRDGIHLNILDNFLGVIDHRWYYLQVYRIQYQQWLSMLHNRE